MRVNCVIAQIKSFDTDLCRGVNYFDSLGGDKQIHISSGLVLTLRHLLNRKQNEFIPLTDNRIKVSLDSQDDNNTLAKNTKKQKNKQHKPTAHRSANK